MIAKQCAREPGQLRKFSFVGIIFCFGFLLPALAGLYAAHAQGVATGGTAVPARPLPPGMKPPAVEFRDIAKQAGLVGVKSPVQKLQSSTLWKPPATAWRSSITITTAFPTFFWSTRAASKQTLSQPKHFLYHNLGGLKFEDVTEKAGIKPTGWGQGVCVGDIDNDGYPDLFVTQWGQNVLYRNQGNGKFQRRDQRARPAFAKTALEHGLCVHRFQPRRISGSGGRPLCGLRPGPHASPRANKPMPVERKAGHVRSARPAARNALVL